MTYRRLDITGEQLEALHTAGWSFHDIATHFGISYDTVLRRLGATRHVPDPTPSVSFPFDPRPWTARALCMQTDPERFFPEKGGSTREAKAVCRRCDVRAECLEYALANREPFGIWGGLSERERRRLLKGVA